MCSVDQLVVVHAVGMLRNTEPLDYSVKHNFILEVKAEDCGGRMSDKLLVNIVVKPACRNGWKGTSLLQLYKFRGSVWI